MRRSGKLIASFHSFLKLDAKAHIASEAKAMHKALSANLHNAKASAQCKCALDIAHQMADCVEESHCKDLQQLRKARSTAGRGDPSASTSAKPSLGEDQTHFSCMRQDCVGRLGPKGALGCSPSRKHAESGNAARERIKKHDCMPWSRPTESAAATLARAECAAIAIGKCY